MVARDPDLPSLAVLLDDEALTAVLGGPVRRDYLRYKPGTSCVLGGRLDLPEGPADVFVTAYDAAGAVKIDKTVADAPDGAILHVDRARGLVAARASADRDLPLLAALATRKHRRRALARLLPGRPDVTNAPLTTLSYKPMRRWVGLLTPEAGPPVVLRAYRTTDAPAAAQVVGELAGGPPRTPRLLGVDLELAALALDWVEGRPLDRLLADDACSPEQLAEVGRVLARLHGLRLDGLPTRTVEDDVAAVRSAAEQVAVLLPSLAGAATDLAEELARRLVLLPGGRTVVHGDFSADQVVVDGDSASLLDLDRAVLGDPAADLASLAAASAAQRGRDVLQGLCVGYAQLRALPADEAVRTHAAALLLRRVVEPFRHCRPDWPERAAALLERAAEAMPGPLERSLDDLVAPLVGGAPAWEVLKDKPGRRRTSRATGPAGTAIVKVYASQRAVVVARRVRALADGPAEPALPRVLRCDAARHAVVLTEVPGRPFRDAVLAGDTAAAARVGRALAGWHAAHRGRVPAGLRVHTAARELEVLRERCAAAPGVGSLVRAVLPPGLPEWVADTVVHRDLYEDQVVLDRVVGLLDLDDAAAGPAELDLGNLSAHLHLLGLRSGVDVAHCSATLLEAYADRAPLDHALLARCRTLSLLRLACVHGDPSLVAAADERTLIAGSPGAHASRAG